MGSVKKPEAKGDGHAKGASSSEGAVGRAGADIRKHCRKKNAAQERGKKGLFFLL